MAQDSGHEVTAGQRQSQHERLGTPLALSYNLDLISLRVQNSDV